MTERMFRLLELHQKLDAAIRRMKTSRASNQMELARLMKRKVRLRDRLARLLPPQRPLAGL